MKKVIVMIQQLPVLPPNDDSTPAPTPAPGDGPEAGTVFIIQCNLTTTWSVLMLMNTLKLLGQLVQIYLAGKLNFTMAIMMKYGSKNLSGF